MNDTSQNTVEHLKLVEGVIARLADNSSQIKTWAVSLVTAALIFSGLSDNPPWMIGAAGFMAVVAFCLMDARYLHLQKCYRKLYRAAADGKTVEPFEMDYHKYVASVDSAWKLIFSWSVFGFYGAVLLVLSILMIVLSTLGECNEAQSLL